MHEAMLNKFTVAQLKENCTQRGLETTGKKADLVERLNLYLKAHNTDELAKSNEGEEEQMESEAKEENGEDDEADADDVIAQVDEILKDGEEMKEEEEEEEEEEEKGDEEEKEEAMDVTAEGGEKTEDDKEEKDGEKDEEKKEGEDKEKKEEKPKGEGKPKVVGRNEFKRDLNIDIRKRSVVVGPVDPDDLAKDEIQSYAQQAVSFFVRIHYDEEKQQHFGHIEFRFKTWDEAAKVVEEFPKLSEDFVVKQLAEALNAEMVDREIRKSDVEKELVEGEVKKDVEKEDVDCRTISAYNIPLTTSEEQLKSLFSEAKSMLIAKDNEGTFKGVVYLEYPTSEAAKEAFEKHKEEDIELEGKKVHYHRITVVPKSKRMQDRDGDEVLTDERRDFLFKKVKQLRTQLNNWSGNLTINKRRNYETQIYRIERRLERDTELRKEKGLPVRTPKKTPQSTPNRKPQNQQQGRWQNRGGDNYRRGNQYGGYNRGGQSLLGSSPPPSLMGNQQRGQGQGSYRGGWSGGAQQGGQRMNTQATANAVNLLVGLSNMLSSNRGQGGRQSSGQAGHWEGGNNGYGGMDRSSGWGGGQSQYANDGYGSASYGTSYGASYGGGYGASNYGTGNYGGGNYAGGNYGGQKGGNRNNQRRKRTRTRSGSEY